MRMDPCLGFAAELGQHGGDARPHVIHGQRAG